MKFFVLALTCLVAVAQGFTIMDEILDEWEDFKDKHGELLKTRDRTCCFLIPKLSCSPKMFFILYSQVLQVGGRGEIPVLSLSDQQGGH